MTENKNSGACCMEQNLNTTEDKRRWMLRRLEDKAYIAKLECMLYRSLMREEYGWDV